MSMGMSMNTGRPGQGQGEGPGQGYAGDFAFMISSSVSPLIEDDLICRF